MAIGYDGSDREWEDFMEDIAIPRAAVEGDDGCPDCDAAEGEEHDISCDLVDEEYEETDEDEESDAD